MACFTVTMAEGVLVSAAQITTYVLERKGKITYKEPEDGSKVIKWSKKLGILNSLLWGGSVLLALEHVFHGEVTSYFPFLTAMETAEDTAEMLHEMATAGVTMAIAITALWAIGLLVYRLLSRKSKKLEVVKEGK